MSGQADRIIKIEGGKCNIQYNQKNNIPQKGNFDKLRGADKGCYKADIHKAGYDKDDNGDNKGYRIEGDKCQKSGWDACFLLYAPCAGN